MKVIFFGTPEYTLPILGVLYKEYGRGLTKNLAGVVTQPPRPVGRKKKMTHSPTDNWAYKKKIPVWYELDKLPEAELGILAAYGEIIPQRVIEQFKYGILNIHPSLLPKWRGASPVQAAIISGESETGVSVIKMDKELDHGEIVSSFKEEIRDDDTTESLRERLFSRSAEFLINLIPNYVSKKIKLKPQEHEKASWTRTITKKDGLIPPEYLEAALGDQRLEEKWKIGLMDDFELEVGAQSLERFIRAMWPWPTAWSRVKIQRDKDAKILRILKARVKEGKLVLDEVQLEGKNPVSWKQLREGYPEIKF